MGLKLFPVNPQLYLVTFIRRCLSGDVYPAVFIRL
jgi:hypothetical protein